MAVESSLSILIVDDHELVGFGIKSKLENILPGAKFDVFTEGERALSTLSQVNYDLYIVDLELQDMTGFELIDGIKEANPKARILICTLHEEMWYVKELKELEVSGILFKSSCLNLLDKAVTEILADRTFFCDQYKMLTNNHKEKGYRYLLYESFTQNEYEVLCMIGKGYTTSEIGKEKSWSIKTVEYYRKRLFDKFGVTNVSRLVAIAVREGFLKKEHI